VGLGLSRLAPVALLAGLAVNRVDEKRFGAPNPPRHGCVHFSSPLGVNKEKEPPKAAAPNSCQIFSPRPIQAGTNWLSIWQEREA